MLLSEFILAMAAFVFAGLAVITFSMYYAYRSRENLVRAVSFLLLSLAFFVGLYYHSSKINLILIHRGAFGFENPSGLAFALMIDLIPFRGPPVYLFGTLTALASPEVYTPSGLNIALIALSKLFLVAGLVLLVYQSILIYLGEVLGRRSLVLVGLSIILALVSLVATLSLASMVRGPLAEPDEARARMLMNIAALSTLALSVLALSTSYSYFKVFRETGERSYLFQAAGFLILALFMAHLSGVSSSLTLDLAGAAITSFEAQASVTQIYLAMFLMAALSSVLLALGMILEIAPPAAEEEEQAAEESS